MQGRMMTTALCALALAALPGCAIPLSAHEINAQAFSSPQDLEARSAELRAEMTSDEVFETLGVEPELFRMLSPTEVRETVYGDFEVRGGPADLDRFRERLAGYSGYELTYRCLKRTTRIGAVKLIVHEKGYDQKLVLIFDRGILFRSTVIGSPDFEDSESTYLWKALGSAAARGAKAALR